MSLSVSRLRYRCAIAAGALALSVALTPGGVAAFDIVYDPSNYAQNVLTAARALQQINNQITSLANQTQMLINQARHLASLPTSVLSQIEGNFAEMKRLMGEADRLAYNVSNIEAQFSPTFQTFAAGKTDAQLITSARDRWQQSLSAYEHSLKAGAVAVQNLNGTRAQTSTLVDSSQSAVGVLQATQAGNQLLGVQTRQLADLTVMLAAQGRADALETSRKAAAQEQSREQLSRFLTGSSYSPTPVRMFHD